MNSCSVIWKNHKQKFALNDEVFLIECQTISKHFLNTIWLLRKRTITFSHSYLCIAIVMFHMQLVHSGLNIQFDIFTMRPFSSSLKFCRFSANFILQHSCTIPTYQVFVDKDKMPVCLSARIGIPPVCRPNPCDPQP